MRAGGRDLSLSSSGIALVDGHTRRVATRVPTFSASSSRATCFVPAFSRRSCPAAAVTSIWPDVPIVIVAPDGWTRVSDRAVWHRSVASPSGESSRRAPASFAP